MTFSVESRALDAAFELYVSEGIAGVSMRRLATQIGVTAPALYKHFDDKEALIEAIAERGFGLFDGLVGELPRARSTIQGITALLRCYRDFAIDEPHLFDIMFVEPRARLRVYPEDFASGRSMSFNMLHAAVTRGIGEGAFRKDDPLEVTVDLWAHAHGLIGLYRAGRFGTDVTRFQRLFDRSTKRFIRGMSNDARETNTHR